MGVWHRYVLRRAGTRVPGATDAGITLVEILVAIILLSIALIGTAGEVAAYVKQQVVEKSQINANHLADSWFEYAESISKGTAETALSGVNTQLQPVDTASTNTDSLGGVTFTETMTPRICTAAQLALSTFTINSCSTSAGGSLPGDDTVYSTIHITWKLGDTYHQLTQTRNLADNSTYNPGPTSEISANALANCTRANPNAKVSIPLALTPTSGPGPGAPAPIDTDSSNHPVITGNTVSASITVTGLVDTVDAKQMATTNFGPADCIPLQWNDSNGLHQVDMHTVDSGAGACKLTPTNYTATPCTYTAQIPTASITQAVSGPSFDAPITFTADLIDAATGPPVVSAVTSSATMTVDGPPKFLTCAASAVGKILGLITLGTNIIEPAALPTTFLGTGVNISPTSTLTVTYTNTSNGTSTVTLPSILWTVVGSASSYNQAEPKGTLNPAAKGALLGLGNTFSYTVTRPDGKASSCAQNPTAVTILL